MHEAEGWELVEAPRRPIPPRLFPLLGPPVERVLVRFTVEYNGVRATLSSRPDNTLAQVARAFCLTVPGAPDPTRLCLQVGPVLIPPLLLAHVSLAQAGVCDEGTVRALKL